MFDDDHYEYTGRDPSRINDWCPTYVNPDECREMHDLTPTDTIWRRQVTYGPWEAVTVDDDGAPLAMRRFAGIVAAEGKETTDKRIIGQGALTLPTEPVPLMKLRDENDDRHHGADLVGKFTGFRRHGLFVAVEGLTTLEKGEYGVGVDLGDATFHVDDEGVMHITSASIMGAHVVKNPAWPFLAVIEVE